MKRYNKITLAILCSSLLNGCFDESNNTTETDNKVTVTSAKTAPTIPVKINPIYKSSPTIAKFASITDQNIANIANTDSDADWQAMTEKYQRNIETYNQEGEKKRAEIESNGDSYPNFLSLQTYNASQTYATAGNKIRYTESSPETDPNSKNRTGVFKNKWWTKGNLPSFDSIDGPWELIVQTDADGKYFSLLASVSQWSNEATYLAGHIVSFNDKYYEAQYWTKGDTPTNPYEQGDPWKEVAAPSDVDLAKPNPEDDLAEPPTVKPEIDCAVTPEAEGCTPPDDTPTTLPILPEPDPDPTPDPDLPSPDIGNDGLPTEGYEFLKELTIEQWDWLFPLRYGKCHIQGGTNNPCGTMEDDQYTLANFKKAVLEYNTWAASKNYKQFLNQGSKSQQATEFTAFFAKSARETSGSWANAPSPWIENDQVAGTVWKGALYWLEEVGYSTIKEGDKAGTSPAVSYIDTGSSYTPVQGRSYHGRGIIQLSWNYNYGAFSSWLFNNQMLRDMITEENTLLKRPDYVTSKAEVSFLSGIWFWMTPQGAKPASQDVILGNITNISTSSQDQGLPQLINEETIEPPVTSGETQDQAVMAYRLGTIIDIVNGGLECNKAAAWHTGPLQRVSYYNAYAKYLNAQLNVSIPTIDAATNVWNEKVSMGSPSNLRLATCYSLKAYYGW